MISLHTFENLAFGASKIDTPIEDEKWSGRFVERIRGSSRESSIGVVKNGGYTSDSPSVGPLKTTRTPTAATLFGEKSVYRGVTPVDPDVSSKITKNYT